MLSLSLCPKAITLSGFHCTFKTQIYDLWSPAETNWYFLLFVFRCLFTFFCGYFQKQVLNYSQRCKDLHIVLKILNISKLMKFGTWITYCIEIRYISYRIEFRNGKFDIYCIVSNFEMINLVFTISYQISIWSICMCLQRCVNDRISEQRPMSSQIQFYRNNL